VDRKTTADDATICDRTVASFATWLLRACPQRIVGGVPTLVVGNTLLSTVAIPSIAAIMAGVQAHAAVAEL
jgi:hypothetical protein